MPGSQPWQSMGVPQKFRYGTYGTMVWQCLAWLTPGQNGARLESDRIRTIDGDLVWLGWVSRAICFPSWFAMISPIGWPVLAMNGGLKPPTIHEHRGNIPVLEPIGSMYGIYANIWGILMVNVTIYSIHGAYGEWIAVGLQSKFDGHASAWTLISPPSEPASIAFLVRQSVGTEEQPLPRFGQARWAPWMWKIHGVPRYPKENDLKQI